jgi:hypothetical protein
MNASVKSLPTFIRYDYLNAHGIVKSRPQLKRLIEKEGFPPGQLFGAGTRVWDIDEVMVWVKSRPTKQTKIERAKTRTTEESAEVV